MRSKNFALARTSEHGLCSIDCADVGTRGTTPSSALRPCRLFVSAQESRNRHFVPAGFVPTCCRSAAGCFPTRERHVGDSARDAAVAVVKRVNGDKPEMREAGFHDRIDCRCYVEPVENAFMLSSTRGAAGASK